MELIDRHNLIIEILAHDVCDDKTIDKIILDAPTVDAIPIEWLKKHLITHGQVVNGDYWWDDATNINEYIMMLFEEWEKENERASE